MSLLAVLSTALSFGFILFILKGDPKRRRALGIGGRGQGPALRRLLAAAALAPGLACLLLGDPAAFLIWLGGCAVSGWIAAIILARPRGAEASRRL